MGDILIIRTSIRVWIIYITYIKQIWPLKRDNNWLQCISFSVRPCKTTKVEKTFNGRPTIIFFVSFLFFNWKKVSDNNLQFSSWITRVVVDSDIRVVDTFGLHVSWLNYWPWIDNMDHIITDYIKGVTWGGAGLGGKGGGVTTSGVFLHAFIWESMDTRILVVK